VEPAPNEATLSRFDPIERHLSDAISEAKSASSSIRLNVMYHAPAQRSVEFSASSSKAWSWKKNSPVSKKRPWGTAPSANARRRRPERSRLHTPRLRVVAAPRARGQRYGGRGTASQSGRRLSASPAARGAGGPSGRCSRDCRDPSGGFDRDQRTPAQSPSSRREGTATATTRRIEWSSR